MGKTKLENGGIIGPTVTPADTLVTHFDSSGTFTSRAGTSTVDVLVVAGGGGGGNGGTQAGGAGAGGLVLAPGIDVGSETPIAVTIGAGGGASAAGSDTTFGAGSCELLFNCKRWWRWWKSN